MQQLDCIGNQDPITGRGAITQSHICIAQPCQDAVVDTTNGMGKFAGQFRSGKAAEEAAGTLGQIPFKLDADSLVICSAWEDKECLQALTPQFSTEPVPVSSFLEFLWKNHNKIDTQIIAHSCNFDDKNRKWKVVQAKAACLQIDVEKKSTYSFTDTKISHCDAFSEYI